MKSPIDSLIAASRWSASAARASIIRPIARLLQKNIDETKAFIELSHDVGGSGVKVRPNGLPKDVPEENTLQQIAKALGEVAAIRRRLRAGNSARGPRPRYQ